MNTTKSRAPLCLFMYNPNNLERNNPSIFIETLKGLENFTKLKDTIEKCLSHLDQNYEDLRNYELEEDNSHGSIINKQKEELRRLEMEEENKKKNIQEQMKSQEKKPEVSKFIEEKILKPNKIYISPKEPEINDPNSCNILIRLLDGSAKERRFYKTNTIDDVYNYLLSLPDSNLKEGSFELIQTFPFKIFNVRNKTLEEEKLYPNAVIQLKDID